MGRIALVRPCDSPVRQRFQPNIGIPEAGQPTRDFAECGIFLTVDSFRIRTQKARYGPNAFTALAHFINRFFRILICRGQLLGESRCLFREDSLRS